MSAQDWRLRERAVLHSQIWRDALALRDAGDLCDRTRWAARGSASPTGGPTTTTAARELDIASGRRRAGGSL